MKRQKEYNHDRATIKWNEFSDRVAKQLYPSADISIKGFEKTEFNDNSFDVAIGNVPFGDFKLSDEKYDKA